MAVSLIPATTQETDQPSRAPPRLSRSCQESAAPDLANAGMRIQRTGNSQSLQTANTAELVLLGGAATESTGVKSMCEDPMERAVGTDDTKRRIIPKHSPKYWKIGFIGCISGPRRGLLSLQKLATSGVKWVNTATGGRATS